MFDIRANPQLNKDSFSFSDNGGFPYFTRTVFNNGIAGYVDYLDDEHKIKGNCLAVGMIGMQFFYMQKDFYAGQFTKRLTPKAFNLTPRLATYFISLLNKSQDVLKNVLVRDFEPVLKKTKIQLPTKNGNVDFEFMESFIAELEVERIAELEAYLITTGLKDYTLTQAEQQALVSFEGLEFKEFKVIDIFSVKNTKNILSRDIVENSGNTPYLCASAENNAISSYISYDTNYLDKGHCIFIGGKTFVVTYQENDFYSNDSHNLVLSLKNKQEATKKNYLYLATCIYRSLSHQYSWGNSISNKKIQTDKVALPTKNNQPDYALMEIFISAIQKLVIKDVVQYADRKINATKQVVG